MNSVISEKLTSYVTSLTDSDVQCLKVDSSSNQGLSSVSKTPAGTTSRNKKDKRKRNSTHTSALEGDAMSSFKDALIGHLVNDLRKKQKRKRRRG